MVNGLKGRIAVLVAAGVMVSGGLLGTAAVASAAGSGSAPAVTAMGSAVNAPASDFIIWPRATLTKNHAWTSGNGRTVLRMQEDGNFVLYKDGRAAWQAKDVWPNGDTAVFQEDGNFVVYDRGGNPLWASGTWHKGAYLAIQDDGNVVIYDSNHNPVWATNTGD